MERCKARTSAAMLGLALLALPPNAEAADPQHVVKVLDSRECQGCDLRNADLIHADLQDARLKGARLQRANLSGAQLEGADLRGADLSFTTLAGANLRGADLRGSILLGTDLRRAELSGAQIDRGALSRSHWQQARGLQDGLQGYAELHNAGAAAAQDGRYPEAEIFFGEAIRQQPNAAISWVARGITRSQQGKSTLAAQDFRYASELYQQMGDTETSSQLELAIKSLTTAPPANSNGNNAGSAFLSGAGTLLRVLGPIAIKALLPMAL